MTIEDYKYKMFQSTEVGILAILSNNDASMEKRLAKNKIKPHEMELMVSAMQKMAAKTRVTGVRYVGFVDVDAEDGATVFPMMEINSEAAKELAKRA